MFKNIFHIYIKTIETTQNNKVYLTTEAHRKAYYKFYNNHKQEIFNKIKIKYANDDKFKQHKLNSNKQYYEKRKEILSKKAIDRIKRKFENPEYKKNVLQKQKEYNIKYRLWNKTIKELFAISIFDE